MTDPDQRLEDAPDTSLPDVAEEDYPPSDREVGYLGADEFGTTPEEEREGESLDDRLEREEPDITADLPVSVQDVEGADPGAEETDLPAGRLVEPDEGAHTDAEKDLVATNVPPEQDQSAEEAAMRIDPNS